MKERLSAAIAAICPVDPALEPLARHHLDNLTKPRGSLGVLENLAAKVFCIQGGGTPVVDPARIYTVAGDHGVTAEGVSASPQEVTRQMVLNFLNGGAGINVLTRTYGIDLRVVDAGCAGGTFPEHPQLIQRKVAPGTANLAVGPAMSEEQCLSALLLGLDLADAAHAEGVRVIGTGEMGIGNTTPSTAMYCAYFGLEPEELAGPGTGLSPQAVERKAAVIRRALSVNAAAVDSGDPLRILAALGGYEIATLAGLILGAAKNRCLVVVDGFISTAAYAAAWKMCPAAEDYCVFSHASAEPGHGRAMQAMGATPLLHLGLRLGEGTGAAVAMGVLRGAVNIYNEMASFEQAGVSVVH
ncbi:nicotinate-nucleotide--dimethylbenzimidazole phosphoribosyltransferase [Desulfobaculum xiamenense]|uniref:Nicotinate-nucleotide--dimethylbenzimidazole phosphoribosyltransferase n=1 Tax=Desulfobaculum xiamenense TaxID=995050 RepID=A0A846QMC2_9BACT|nr:nicotinate-nucleotide--dimethylbenzimidazole phosphoribosyltransferase [Desulfobaculum xiamenense]NJB69298.1 nicotinate-nucleotide--dimethylbenzimidazole phosphoribosyltransferase [Desulfobaculum xiamenense]